MTEKERNKLAESVTLAELPKRDQELVRRALEASSQAYAPYSGFAVGAAVRTKSGKIHTGANIENAAYAVVTCAEMAALACANAGGDFDIEAIAVAGHRFLDPPESTQVVAPCGRCRQVINEAGDVAGTDVIVFSCNGDLTKIVPAKIGELLPGAFGPQTLGTAGAWPSMKSNLKARVESLLAKVR